MALVHGLKIFKSLLLLLILLAQISKLEALQQVFDVAKYGASPTTPDNTQAFLAAWKEACNYSGVATFLVPKGNFTIGAITFEGPCQSGLSPLVQINGLVKALSNLSAFQLSEQWIQFRKLNGLVIDGSGGTLDGQGDTVWSFNDCDKNRSCKMLPTTLDFERVENSSLSSLSLVNSKSFHMSFYNCNSIDVHDLRITAPSDSPNTDGIHVARTTNINITNVVIGTGDDCISIGPGSNNVFIANIRCGPGHGISVGSLGKYDDVMDVFGVHVKNCTINNTTNGVRIKTWPGSPPSQASLFTFEDIIVHNVTNPIIIDQNYCPVGTCTTEPSQVKISDITFRNVTGTCNTKDAVTLECSKSMPCSNVHLQDIKLQCAGGSGCINKCSSVEVSFAGMQTPPPCVFNASSIARSPVGSPVSAPVSAPRRVDGPVKSTSWVY